MSDLPQHCTFVATGSFFIVLQVLQFIIPEFFITFIYIQVIYWIASCIKCSSL